MPTYSDLLRELADKLDEDFDKNLSEVITKLDNILCKIKKQQENPNG